MTTSETEKTSLPSEVVEIASAASRILVVEDDLHTRTILHKRLKKNGYNVEIAENGLEGWEKVESFRPDIIISDWMMPVMDGHELCTKVKGNEKTRSTFFILLTAKDAPEDKVGALDAGADEYLVKPCDPQELLARVRAAEDPRKQKRRTRRRDGAHQPGIEDHE